MRKVIVAIADTHAGCKYALCSPNVELYDRDSDKTYRPNLTVSQEYLWENYCNDVARVFEFANDDEMILLHNGDATHGVRFHSELVTTAAADQITIAVMNLKPWFAYPRIKAVRLISGTGVHTMGESSSEIAIVQVLRAEYPHADVAIKTHGLISCGKDDIDVAHHGPFPGSRDWLTGNVARFYLRDLMNRELKAHKRPPRLVLRAHYHKPVHEYLENNGDAADIFILPSWSLLDEHAQKATQSTNEVTNGVTAFEFVDGEMVGFRRWYHKLDVRQVEEL